MFHLLHFVDADAVATLSNVYFASETSLDKGNMKESLKRLQKVRNAKICEKQTSFLLITVIILDRN